VTRREAKILIEQWRQFYNNERPPSALGNRTPAEAGLQRSQNQNACDGLCKNVASNDVSFRRNLSLKEGVLHEDEAI
jgi:hypothetical protein